MSASAAAPSSTIGALLVGNVLGVVFYGFTTSQGFMYYSLSQKEPLLLRLYIFATWVVDTVNTALLSHSQYYYFITNYAVPSALSTPAWSLVTMVVLSAVVSFMVRMVFVMNVWKMSMSNFVVTGAMALLSIFSLVCGVLLTIHAHKVVNGHFKNVETYIYLDLGSAILADAALSATLWYYLKKQKIVVTSSLGRLDVLVVKFKTYVVGTGMLNVVIALLILVLYAAMPDKLVFLTPFMLWSKFHTNALFTSNNARCRRERGKSVSVSLSSGSTGPRFNTRGGQRPTTPVRTVLPTQVNIMQETVVERDDDIKYLGKAY